MILIGWLSIVFRTLSVRCLEYTQNTNLLLFCDLSSYFIKLSTISLKVYHHDPFRNTLYGA